MDAKHPICFGSFTLDPDRRVLLHAGAPVAVGSRAFDLLCALVERRGQLATKNELMGEVWPRTVVDENNLAAQVVALRKVLSADPGLSKCIQTISGRGYRFVADIAMPAELAAFGHVPVAAYARGSGALSLVVLPFANLSNDVEQAYFAQGLSHTIATDLSRIAGLLVIAPTTAATFDGRTPDAR
jgi:DNA-binding winged helix-turn-helix (wHTH) protein